MRSKAEFEVCDFADYAQFLPIVAEWIWAEWDRQAGHTLPQTMAECETWLRRDAVPVCVIALQLGQPVGVMCLLPRDLDERPDLSPWMANQYVVPAARGPGIAWAMVRALEAKAVAMKIDRLYMWTKHNPRLYRRSGYVPLAVSSYCGAPVSILSKGLS